MTFLVRIVLVVTTSLLSMAPVVAEEPEAADPWAPVRVLVGEWRGTGSGFGGESEVRHTYRFVIQDNFIHSTTLSKFPPKDDGNPEETHEDWGFFSYDFDRKRIVYRQFLSEGFVNTYVLEDRETSAATLVFTSESTEGAGGTAARLIFRFEGEDSYRLVLELAPPGRDFFSCQEMSMRRTTREAEDR